MRDNFLINSYKNILKVILSIVILFDSVSLIIFIYKYKKLDIKI